MRIVLAAALAVLLTCGCFGSPPVAEQAPEPAEGEERPEGLVELPDGTAYVTVNASGRINHDALYLGVDMAASHGVARADVPANATGLVAELRWSGTVADFDLVVFSPHFCPDAGFPFGTVDSVACWFQHWATKDSEGAYRAQKPPGVPADGSLRLQLHESQVGVNPCREGDCQWQAVAWWDAAVDAEYELRLTVFHDGKVPEGFTAFEEA